MLLFYGHQLRILRLGRSVLAILFLAIDVAPVLSVLGADCTVAPTGLIGWWPGDGDARDIAGTNDGILQGGASAESPAVVGSGFSFDGTNAYVEVTDSPLLHPALLTVEAWVRFDSLDSPSDISSTGQQYIIWKANSANLAGYGLEKQRTASGDVFSFQVADPLGKAVEIESVSLISTGAWYHVVAMRGPGFIQLYVNGLSESGASVGFAQDYANSSLYFGSSGNPLVDYKFCGRLDEVSLYNRSLSPTEVASLYRAGAAGKCKGVTINSQPQSQTVVAGTNAGFSAAATGLEPLSWQWQFNGTNLAGATASNLLLTNIQPPDAGDYVVVVTNNLSVTSSTAASLSVLLPPKILASTHSAAMVAEPGSQMIFSIAVLGTQPLTYRWQANESDLVDDGHILGANTSVLQISCLQPKDTGSYSVVVSNIAGTISSVYGTLTVTQLVAIPDPQFAATITCATSKTNCPWLNTADLSALTKLSACNYQISNLFGLEWATNLTDLDLSGNAISDISLLQRLPQLARLNLDQNNITDISSLAALTNLNWLSLSGNRINDYGPLGGLARLTSLSVHDGGITNIAFAQGLYLLTELNLYRNRFTDISPLAGLKNLSRLDLRWNPIANHSVLSFAHNLTQLYLAGNSISNVTFLQTLPGLTFLNLADNQIRDLSPLAILRSLNYLAVSHNPAWNYAPLASLTGLASFEARGNSISNVAFLSGRTALTYADLAYNSIADLSPLASNTNLSLVLEGNTNLDFSSVALLTNAVRLWLNGNSVSDVGFLQNMTNLRALGLDDNNITDLSPLAGLTNLEHIGLSRNPVSNFDVLGTFPKLTGVRLEGSSLQNISALTNLSQISFLSLNDNLIADSSQFSALTNLASLYLAHNRLTNVASLVTLPRMGYLDISRNLSDVSDHSSTRTEIQSAQQQCSGANVTYLPANHLSLSPFLSMLPNWYVPSGRPSSFVFNLFDEVVPAGELIVTATSSDESIIPNANVLISGTNETRTLTVTPIGVGVVTNALTAMDAPGGLSTNAYIVTHVLSSDPAFAVGDPTLANDLSAALNVPSGALQSVDLLNLTSFGSLDQSIASLSGLEWASNLTSLLLVNNDITNLAPLGNLKNLSSLSLSGNRISDLSPIAGLRNLSFLDVSSNPITNYLPLLSLTNLLTLYLAGNSCSNLDFLTNLPQLTTLNLSGNKITDLSPLAGMTNLSYVLLQQNRLSDVSVLTNLPSLTYVDLRVNLLEVTTNAAINELRARVAYLAYLPQREPPVIDVRTNWVVAPHATSSLSFNIFDSGPVNEQLRLGIGSSSPYLLAGLTSAYGQSGAGVWTLRALPTLDTIGTAWITLTATNDVLLSTSTTILVEVTNLQAVTPELLGDPEGSWGTGGDAQWFGQGLVTHDGHAVAQSGAIGNNQQSWIQTTVTGPGRLSFWWKVSSELGYDWLDFSVVGQHSEISGEVDWQHYIANVPPGLQALTWHYYKNGNTSSGLDAAWLDQVVFEPGVWLEVSGAPTNGLCELTLHAVPGSYYEILATTNLTFALDVTNWISLGPSVTPTNSDFLFTDTNAVPGVRLYRLHRL
jgi:internalin A